MTRRRTYLLITCLMLGMLMGACAAPQASPTVSVPTQAAVSVPTQAVATSAPTETAAKTVRVAFVAHDTASDFSARMEQGARDAAKDYGIDLTFTGPPATDNPAQIAMFDSLLETKPDAMIVTSTDPGVWVEPIKRAVDKGVLVLTADTDTPDSARLAFFGVDAQGLGLLLGQEVRKIVGDTGKIIIGECVLGPSPHKLREAGFRSAFEGTSVKIVGPFETNCDATQNFNTWQNIYTANQDAVALVGLTAVETASLGKLKQQTKGKFVAASFDPGAAGLPMMIDGYLSVCVGQNPYLSGYLTVQAIAKHFRDGRDIKPGINLFPGEYILPKDAPALIQREGMGKPMTDWYKTFLDQNNLRDFALK